MGQIESNNTSWLNGNVGVVLSESGTVISPTTIIRTSQAALVTVNWWVAGTFTTWNLNTYQFQVSAYLESIGPGSEYAFPATPQIVNGANPPPTPGISPNGDPDLNYTTTITINAGDVAAGAYVLTVYLTLNDTMGNPQPVAGFEEIQMVQFYKFP